MKNNIKNINTYNFVLLLFTYLKNVNFREIANLINPYAINNIKAINAWN